MKQKLPPLSIYQSKSGINLLDGFFLVRNSKTHKITWISISKGTVYIHDVTRQMALQTLINMDASGQLDVFEALKLSESDKRKSKNKKNND